MLLVDRHGRVLLQERDQHAPVAPDKWGMVGGHVEDGEDFESAAYRELEEEAGVRLDGGLLLWRAEHFHYSDSDEPSDYRVWVAGTSLTDADIVVGEGRRIVFVEPEAIPGPRHQRVVRALRHRVPGVPDVPGPGGTSLRQRPPA